jgi:hypothetical protein
MKGLAKNYAMSRSTLFLLLIVSILLPQITKAQGLLLSASSTGKYAMIKSTATGELVLMNMENKTVVESFDSSYTSLTWVDDAIVLLLHEDTAKAYINAFAIRDKSLSVLDSTEIDEGWHKNIYHEAALPLRIRSCKDFFFVYMDGNDVYKFSFFPRKIQLIGHVPRRDEEYINSVCTDANCSRIIVSMSSEKEPAGRLITLYPGKTGSEAINTPHFSNNERNLCYFINDKEAVYFDVQEINHMPETDVVVYNVQSGEFRTISSQKGITLSAPVFFPGKEQLIINVFQTHGADQEFDNNDLSNAVKSFGDYFSEGLSFITLPLSERNYQLSGRDLK